MSANLEIRPGTQVRFNGRDCEITHVLDLDTALVKDSETGKQQKAQISQLKPPDSKSAPRAMADVAGIPDKDWQTGQNRLVAIRPLLENPSHSRKDVERRAEEVGVDPATLYRWINLYCTTNNVTALVPAARNGGRGKSRLHSDTEAILVATVEDVYLSDQRYSIERTIREVQKRCRNAKVQQPHPNTIRNRIRALSERDRLRRRRGHHAVRHFEPLRGEFPNADWPLSVVQIDHTPIDLILVDDIHRRPIGRPYITLAIDVFSRMVAGFYVSLDPPGSLSTGACLAHAILPKETWLAKLEVEGSWPLWGVMGTVHADNAKEFRGNMLGRACENYGVNIEWRPVARPQYGAHIERLLGTFSKEIHNLPGTTFSNTTQRDKYPSEKRAAFTLSEFEAWLATYICNVYHQKTHSGLGMTPLQRYEEGVFGSETQSGRGLPARITDEWKLRLDFMPYIERSVQQYGLIIDKVHYYADVLRPWIHAKEPGNSRIKRKFLVRRDPRDISTVYFYDPETQQYYDIPYRDPSRPAISIWELREARRWLKEHGQPADDEDALFAGYERMQEIEDAAVKETKRMRRNKQRRRTNAERVLPPKADTSPPDFAALDSGDIEPFEDLEDLNDGNHD